MNQTSSPNILFLMADDHQAMSLGCAGNPDIATPHLDGLAADGMRFDRCYATSPLCMPSRATVFTGLHEYRHGVNFKPDSYSVTAPMDARIWATYSYAALLSNAGYRTGFAGKWGFPLDVGDYSAEFDSWGGFDGHFQGSYRTAENPALERYAADFPHVTRALGAFGQDFIREASEDARPFCLSISFKAPHKPHDVIDPVDRARYETTTFAKRENWGLEAAGLLPSQARLGRQYYLYRDWDAERYDDHIRAYYRLISGIDDVVGSLRAELDRTGVAENTVIIYTSDNGYYCGSHGLGGKVLPHEEASRVPLIVMDPRNGASGRSGTRRQASNAAVVGTIDFAPTILELAGIGPVDDADGASLVPLLDGRADRVRESLPLISNWGWAENDHSRCMAVVTEEAKYTFWPYGDEHIAPAEELYDLQTDPFELSNAAAPAGPPGRRVGDVPDGSHESELLLRMRRLYDAHLKEWGERCVDSQDYTRHRRLLDRHVSPGEKEYRPAIGKAEPCRVLRELYDREVQSIRDDG